MTLNLIQSSTIFRFLITITSILLFNTAGAQTRSSGDSWAETKLNKQGKLACLWNESYGIVYKDETGNIKGVCVDILEDFRKFVKAKYSVDLEILLLEEKSFATFLTTISGTQNILGVSSVSITEERKKLLQFTPHFLANPNVIVTHKDAPKLEKLDNLSTLYTGYKVKIVSGSTHTTFAQRLKEKYYKDLVVEQSPSSRMIFSEMVSNKKLFTIIDFGEFLGAFKNKMPLVRQNVNLGYDDKLAFIMHKKSDWGVVWQEFLTDSYRKSIAYKKIIADNLGVAYLGLIQ
jgi:ABC-type amino acid transport substrate-binding protein